MFLNEDPHPEAIDVDGVRHISTVPWKEWNPHACVTPWESSRDVYKVVTCGTRIVRLLSDGSWGRSRVQICDFHPYARHQVRYEPDSKGHGITEEETQIEEKGFDTDHVGVAEGMRDDDAKNGNDGHPTVTHEYVNPQSLVLGSMFMEPVRSALPYLETTTVEELVADYVMMDFENMYFIHVSATISRIPLIVF